MPFSVWLNLGGQQRYHYEFGTPRYVWDDLDDKAVQATHRRHR